MQRQNRNNKLNRLNISKAQYCWLWQCPKRAWLQKYKPELAEEDAGAKSRMAAGRMVGEIAKGLFDSYVDVTVRKGDFLDIPAMKAATMQEMVQENHTFFLILSNFHQRYSALLADDLAYK